MSRWGKHEDVRARLAQSVERQALNLMVVGSSPTVGVLFIFFLGGVEFFFFVWEPHTCVAARQTCQQITQTRKLNQEKEVHHPGIEPGSHRWQRCILPLDR